MQLSATPAPPSAWLDPNRVLASFSYVREDGMAYSPRPALARGSIFRRMPEYAFAGADLQGAIDAARAAALKSGWPAAQAVLQAADGAYWIAALEGAPPGSPTTGFVRPHGIDGSWFERNRFAGVQVARVAPELVAVVGAERTLRFD